MMRNQRLHPRHGFTLTELLIVIAIILLVSTATIPVALSVLGERDVSDAASTVQAAFSLTRDTAVRQGQPVGLRLVPDPDLDNPSGRLASNRLLELQVPPNHTDGKCARVTGYGFATLPGGFVIAGKTWGTVTHPSIPNPPFPGNTITVTRIAVVEQKVEAYSTTPPVVLPTAPTSWFSNIRQGDRIKFNNTSTEYHIAGPLHIYQQDNGTTSANVVNPDRFIYGDPNTSTTAFERSIPDMNPAIAEFLYLTNGRDDDGDGYIDESFDGVNNNNDVYPASHPFAGQPCIDPGYNGVDDNLDGTVDEIAELLITFLPSGAISYDPSLSEYEPESFIGASISTFQLNDSYTIIRRPLPAPDSREIPLPNNAVIDLATTYLGFAGSERSRVPIDPLTGYVDFLIYPNGQVVPSNYAGNFSAANDYPFFYLWIARREDVFEPLDPDPTTPALERPLLPMPRNAPNYTGQRFIQGDLRMVVINPKSGHASVNTISNFDGSSYSAPFNEAAGYQSGLGGNQRQ